MPKIPVFQSRTPKINRYFSCAQSPRRAKNHIFSRWYKVCTVYTLIHRTYTVIYMVLANPALIPRVLLLVYYWYSLWQGLFLVLLLVLLLILLLILLLVLQLVLLLVLLLLLLLLLLSVLPLIGPFFCLLVKDFHGTHLSTTQLQSSIPDVPLPAPFPTLVRSQFQAKPAILLILISFCIFSLVEECYGTWCHLPSSPVFSFLLFLPRFGHRAMHIHVCTVYSVYTRYCQQEISCVCGCVNMCIYMYVYMLKANYQYGLCITLAIHICVNFYTCFWLTLRMAYA